MNMVEIIANGIIESPVQGDYSTLHGKFSVGDIDIYVTKQKGIYDYKYRVSCGEGCYSNFSTLEHAFLYAFSLIEKFMKN